MRPQIHSWSDTGTHVESVLDAIIQHACTYVFVPKAKHVWRLVMEGAKNVLLAAAVWLRY
jgi:hypothetical protein